MSTSRIAEFREQIQQAEFELAALRHLSQPHCANRSGRDMEVQIEALKAFLAEMESLNHHPL